MSIFIRINSRNDTRERGAVMPSLTISVGQIIPLRLVVTRVCFPFHFGIGEMISVEKQLSFPDASSLGEYFRNKVYEMPIPGKFVLGNFI